MCSSFFKNYRTIFLICALSTISITNAQEVRVIDNKGTIETIRNNNVYTSPTDPVTITTNEVVEGDVWFDNTDPNNIITKIYDGTNWLLVNTKVSLLQDADTDTKIQVEEGADDDTIRFDTAGTERVVITPTGNINLTTANRIISGNTGLTLQQTGDTFGSTALHIRNRNGENGATFEQLGSVDLVDFAFKTLSNQMNLRVEDRATYVSFADPEFQFSTNTTTFANLGINGGDPALLLRNGTTGGSVYFGNTAHGVKRNFASTANDVGLFTTSGAIRLSTNGETPGEFVLTDTGNVGIGTTTPTQKLDVLGSARIDEFIFDENNEPGTAGQILSTTATGIDWVNASSTVLIQDADSDTKIQVEEIADEDIIRFDTAGTERAVISATGNVGIGTDNPQAILDINTTVSAGNTIPLRIRPNTTTPTGTASGEFHVAADGLLYTYDASRSKWLSVDRNMIGWGRNSQNTTNEYLRQFNGSQSNNNGWRMIRNGTITAITVQGNANQTYTVQIRKNDATTVIASLAVASAQGNHSNTINVDFNEGDFLQCYLNGNSIDFPQVLIEVTWRQ